MTNAASEKSIREAKKAQKRDQDNEAIVIRQLMSTPQGRRWVWLFLEDTRMFHEAGSLEGNVLAYREGQRNIGLKFFAKVTSHAPAQYLQMTSENSGVKLEQESDSDEPSTDD